MPTGREVAARKLNVVRRSGTERAVRWLRPISAALVTAPLTLGLPACASTEGVGSSGAGGAAGFSANGGGFAGVGGTDGDSCESVYLHYSGPGPDGIWGTADDPVSGAGKAEFNGALKPTTEVIFSAPGADGLWRTDDDTIARVYAISWSSNGSVETLRQKAAGPNGVWLDADDLVVAVTIVEFGPGKNYRQHSYEAPGGDGKWETADDVRVKSAVSSGGRVVWYDGPGPDGSWDTSDDHVQLWLVYGGTYPQSLVALMHTDPGPDGEWQTSDDPVSSGALWSCANDVREMRELTGRGPDGEWGTADDFVQQMSRSVGSGCGPGICSEPIG